MPKNEMEFYLLFVGALVLIFLGLQGLITGKVYFRNARSAENKGWVPRDEMPISYWIGIAIYIASGILALTCLTIW